MFIIIGLLSIVILSGCDDLDLSVGGSRDSQQTTQPSSSQQSTQTPQTAETDTEDKPDEPKIAPVVVIPEILIPTASGSAVEKNGQAIVDFSNMQDGYIMAKYTETTDLKIKLLIVGPDDVQYQYILQPGNEFEAFPLTSGNGRYDIGIYHDKRIVNT